MHRILLIVLPILLVLAYFVQAKPVESVSASFDGILEITGDDPLRINLSGDLYWSAPRLRVDFTQNLTQEEIIAIVDFDGKLATMLYPDTLNGQQFDLNKFSKADYFQRVRDLVSTQPGDTPTGWTASVVKDEAAKAAGQTHTLLTGPSEERVDIWRGKDSVPEKMLITTAKWTLTVNLTGVKYNAAISADKFTVSGDYTIVKVDKLPEGGLPDL